MALSSALASFPKIPLATLSMGLFKAVLYVILQRLSTFSFMSKCNPTHFWLISCNSTNALEIWRQSLSLLGLALRRWSRWMFSWPTWRILKKWTKYISNGLVRSSRPGRKFLSSRQPCPCQIVCVIQQRTRTYFWTVARPSNQSPNILMSRWNASLFFNVKHFFSCLCLVYIRCLKGIEE